jgi:hypothetical protein
MLTNVQVATLCIVVRFTKLGLYLGGAHAPIQNVMHSVISLWGKGADTKCDAPCETDSSCHMSLLRRKIKTPNFSAGKHIVRHTYQQSLICPRIVYFDLEAKMKHGNYVKQISV